MEPREWNDYTIKKIRGESGDKDDKERKKIEGRIEKFYESIKSRMLVAEVIAKIRSGGKRYHIYTNSEYSFIHVTAGVNTCN